MDISQTKDFIVKLAQEGEVTRTRKHEVSAELQSLAQQIKHDEVNLYRIL